MTLSEQDHAKLLAHIQKHFKAPYSCPVCKTNNWNLAREVFEMREFHGGTMVMGGQQSLVPVVPFVCETCKYVMLFGIVGLGLDVLKEIPK